MAVKSAKDCVHVTAHLPNILALRLDGAPASHSYLALGVETVLQKVDVCGSRGEAQACSVLPASGDPLTK